MIGDAAFTNCDRQTTFAAVMRAFDKARPNERPKRVVKILFLGQIDTWREPRFLPANQLKIR
jgi:hypothetical protein